MPSAEEFQLLHYDEEADFYNSYYNLIENNIDKNNANITFEKNGLVNGKEILLTKKYIVEKDGSFNINITILNKSNEEISFVYALENNITLLAGSEKDRYYIGENSRISDNLSNTGEYKGKIFGMADEGYIKIKLFLEANEETNFLYMPNYTISDAVDKLEMNYQNSTIVLCKEINLKPNEKIEYNIKARIEELK